MSALQLPKVETRLFINNEFVDAVSKKTLDVINPATGEVLAKVAEADKADVDIAVAAAKEAFKTWKHSDPSKRRDLLLKLADLVDKNKDELALIESLDNGKPIGIAKAVDISMTAECFRFHAGLTQSMGGSTCPVDGNLMSIVTHEPVGVAAQIIPWNFPILMLAWKLAPMLAAGCVGVLKSSEITPLGAFRMAELIKEAGFPAGVVNIITGYGPTAGNALVEHPDVDKVAFTGSTVVGRMIGEKCGRNLKRCTLELGGKSPMIIAKDADLDKAVATLVTGNLFNSGQVCTCSSRTFVHEDIHDAFVAKLVEVAKTQKMGPGHEDVFMGPVVSETQHKRVMGYIEAGKAEGATCAFGGEAKEGKGYFIQPTVFTGVKDEMKIAREEIFGPVMALFKFKTLDEAIERANKTCYGLSASVISQNIDTALEAANKMRAGTVWINAHNVFCQTCPFGGFKDSGIGRELGMFGIRNYTEVKHTLISLGFNPVK